MPRTWMALVVGGAMMLAGCGGGDREIGLDYEQATCALCGMRVSAPAFGVLRVLPAGDRLAYDSIECAVRDLRTAGESGWGEVYLPDYDDPGSLHPHGDMVVVRADYASPMGGGYAAFKDSERAREQAQERNGIAASLEAFVEGEAAQ